MNKGMKLFAGLLGVLLAVLVTIVIVARNSDGPMEIIAGGPFKTGELATNISDWQFMDEFMTVEMQTMNPPRSRVMWLVVHDNRLFVLSSYMKTRLGRAWKRWPRKLDENNDAIIRVDGKLYELALVRIDDEPTSTGVLARFSEKYNTPYTFDDVMDGSTWLFELTPRAG